MKSVYGGIVGGLRLGSRLLEVGSLRALLRTSSALPRPLHF